MSIRITKNGKMLLLVILAIVVLGSGGYLLWRVLQPDTVAPTDSDAGGGAGACCIEDVGCVSGFVCVDIDCYECEKAYVGGGSGSECGTNSSGDVVSCRTGFYCEVANSNMCCPINPTELWTCVEEYGSPSEGDCQDVKCEWPTVVMSHKNCACERCGGANSSICEDDPVKCTPPSCPEGYDSCGVSGDSMDSSCIKLGYCWGNHPDCNNPFVVYRYCQETVEEPICGDGIFGNTVGEECELGDPTGVSCTWDVCNQTTCKCPVVEPICGDGILGNTEGEECELGNPTGVSCTWDVCNQTTCLCPSTNPDWSMTKVGVESCIEEGDTVEGKAIYTITVTNTGDALGNIDRVVDNLDSKVIADYLNDISGIGTYSNGQITWDLEGDDEIFSIDETQTFTYYIQIPSSAFGTYDNTATAYPSEGESISVDETVIIDCDIPGDTPQTGIIEDSIVRITFGILLIAIGLNWNKLNYSVSEYVSDRRIKNFENRVAKKK